MAQTESFKSKVARPESGAVTLKEAGATVEKLIYPAALAAALSIWFLALRAPLWLDETLSYWQVSGGFAKVWTRSALMPSSIGYLYSLWLAKSLLGNSEIALKVPSLLALLGAVYFLFRTGCELFDRETAYLACILFALEGNVIFAATDARPYAFALLAVTVATLAFIRWMKRGGMARALWFGVAAAGILYFHYLFGSILPAFAIYYFLARQRSLKEDAREVAAALGCFLALSVPLLHRVLGLYHTQHSHIVQEMRHPGLITLNTLAPMQTLIAVVIVCFVAALLRRLKLPTRAEWMAIVMGPLLALVPAGILVAISTTTPAHLLMPRYLSVAAPGSALMWASLVGRVDARWLRQIFGAALVAITVFQFYSSPRARHHELSFKPVHQFVNSIITKDELPVLECSAFIEANYESLPAKGNSENALLSQIAYYPVNAPVTLLPMSLNGETIRLATLAMAEAVREQKRFLAIGPPESYGTIESLAQYSKSQFTGRVLGIFDDIVVAEFRPVGVD